MRLFATSDLHTDYKENFRWLAELSDSDYRNDALIVAGDISDRLEVIRDTFLLLQGKFHQLLFTPGNHELWVRGAEFNSLEKLHLVLNLCDELGVDTRPKRFDDFWVVPLFSWYDYSNGSDRVPKAWADFRFCKWPNEMAPLSEYFLRLNEPRLKSYDAPVFTFSHFIPRSDLLPATEYLRFSWLPDVSICKSLDKQIRNLDSKVHVCGHTHMTFDRVVDGIRYVQHAVRYPRERKTSTAPIKVIWDGP